MPNTLYTLTTNLTLESALTLDSDIVYALQQATLLISSQLQQLLMILPLTTKYRWPSARQLILMNYKASGKQAI